jgi:hypothetical protein
MSDTETVPRRPDREPASKSLVDDQLADELLDRAQVEGAEQRHPFRLGPAEQRVRQLLVDQRRLQPRLPVGLAGHSLSVSHHVVPSRVDHDSESSHVTYTADLTRPLTKLRGQSCEGQRGGGQRGGG